MRRPSTTAVSIAVTSSNGDGPSIDEMFPVLFIVISILLFYLFKNINNLAGGVIKGNFWIDYLYIYIIENKLYHLFVVNSSVIVIINGNSLQSFAGSD